MQGLPVHAEDAVDVLEPLLRGVQDTVSFKWYQSKQDATCRMKLLKPFPKEIRLKS